MTSASNQSRQQHPQAAPAPIISAAEAAALATRFAQVMEALIEIVEAETKHVRAGRTREAATLEPRKTELARQYLADAALVRQCRGYLRQHAPKLLKEIQDRHDLFRALLQINMTVLATAHAVTEGLVRGVSAELTRKSQPQTYTAHGCNSAVSAAPPPMAVSRQL
jgi:hypothetical protein